MGEHTDKAKGKIKQTAGNLSGNKKLEVEGKRNEAKGQAEEVINDAQERARNVKDTFKPTGPSPLRDRNR
jgi:uncharacterized protein YjbJ (UPF0337 family)